MQSHSEKHGKNVAMGVISVLSMKRYLVKNHSLLPWVKFIWCFEDASANIHHKLLPTDCIDVILNLANSMIYEYDGREIIAPAFHINGLRSEHSFIHHTGHIRTFGVSFYSYGLYPFVQKSIQCIQNRICSLEDLSQSLTDKLQSAVLSDSTDEIVCNIEKVLYSELNFNPDFMIKTGYIQEFISRDDNITIQNFCTEKNINLKTFERLVVKHTGYTPQILRRIKRFQTASNQLVCQQASLLDLTYCNSYADQAHLTKDFRSFSGKSPGMFQKEKISVKENAVYNYK